jgi:hypothetical protein
MSSTACHGRKNHPGAHSECAVNSSPAPLMLTSELNTAHSWSLHQSGVYKPTIQVRQGNPRTSKTLSLPLLLLLSALSVHHAAP